MFTKTTDENLINSRITGHELALGYITAFATNRNNLDLIFGGFKTDKETLYSAGKKFFDIIKDDFLFFLYDIGDKEGYISFIENLKIYVLEYKPQSKIADRVSWICLEKEVS